MQFHLGLGAFMPSPHDLFCRMETKCIGKASTTFCRWTTEVRLAHCSVLDAAWSWPASGPAPAGGFPTGWNPASMAIRSTKMWWVTSLYMTWNSWWSYDSDSDVMFFFNIKNSTCFLEHLWKNMHFEIRALTTPCGCEEFPFSGSSGSPTTDQLRRLELMLGWWDAEDSWLLH